MWKKSSKCEAQSCVFVKALPDGSRLVRGDEASNAVKVSGHSWDAFIQSIKSDMFV